MKNLFFFGAIALACTMPATALAAGNTQPAAKPHTAEAQQEVALDDLGKYLGKRVVVHTRLNTTRSGVLTRHSKTEVDLKVDTGAELTIPVDSIKRVTAPLGPPDPLFQKPESPKADPQKPVPQKSGDSSAKKN